jgi:hypothetical protein
LTTESNMEAMKPPPDASTGPSSNENEASSAIHAPLKNLPPSTPAPGTTKSAGLEGETHPDPDSRTTDWEFKFDEPGPSDSQLSLSASAPGTPNREEASSKLLLAKIQAALNSPRAGRSAPCAAAAARSFAASVPDEQLSLATSQSSTMPVSEGSAEELS